MLYYKHYSFDMWLTIIKSDPRFKQYRNKYFHQHYNLAGKPLEEVEAIFRQVDVMCTLINETTGKNIDADEQYLMVISLINGNKYPVHEVDLEVMYQQMEELVLEYIPLVYSNDTADVLAYIKDLKGTINILSNTGFIKGSTLRKIMKLLSLDQYLDFQLYSDETGHSKPSEQFFGLMLAEARTLQPLQQNEIIHIGDNPFADAGGAHKVGINSFLINSNNVPITQLLNYAAPDILLT